MREICTSGSVGGEGGNILTYPASGLRREGAQRPRAGLYCLAQLDRAFEVD